jgi:hypothetical protein
MISALRFFAVVPLHSRLMLLAMGAVLASGAVMLIANPNKGSDVLGPLALLQMLGASSGFAVAARRGHLDLLLTAGPRRTVVALTHLALSVLPGMVVWVVLGTVEMLVARTFDPLAFAPGSVVALCSISALAWALTVRLPRLSGGIAWLLGIAMWVIAWSGGPAVIAAASDGTASTLTRVLVATLCPFVLLGRRLSGDNALLVLPLIAVTAALAAEAVLWIGRMDVPLESTQ